MEMPLCLRLIGLRVTKLKDLAAPPEHPHSIKRVCSAFEADISVLSWLSNLVQFFEPLQDVSARKKFRPNAHENVLDNTADETIPEIYEYHDEHVTMGDQDLADDELGSTDPLISPGQKTRPLRSPLLTHEDKTQVITTKPRSTNTPLQLQSPSNSGIAAKRSASSESHTCHVCEKIIQTDNEGFNSHIDFCLSRDAIRQAHAEASSSPQKSTGGRNNNALHRTIGQVKEGG